MNAIPYALAACFVALVAAWCFVQWLKAQQDAAGLRAEMATLRTETAEQLAVVAKYEDRIALLELKSGMNRG